MLDYLLQELTRLRWFIIVSIIVIVIFYVVCEVLTSKFKFNEFKISVFSTLFDLDRNMYLAIAIMLSRLLFVILSSIFCKDINIGHLISLLVMTIAVSILLNDYKNGIINFLSYFALYIINYLQSALLNFYLNIEKFYLYMIMVVALGLFINLFAIYNFLSTYNSIITNPKEKTEKPKKEKFKIKWQKAKLKQS